MPVPSASLSTRNLASAYKPGQANIDMHLPKNAPIKIKIKLGSNNPIDWVDHVS